MAEPTDAELDAAAERGRLVHESGPCAESVRFGAGDGRLFVEHANGCTVAFPARLVQGLEDASDAELAEVELLGSGYGLHWTARDVDLSVPGIVAGLFGTARTWRLVQGARPVQPRRPHRAATAPRVGDLQTSIGGQGQGAGDVTTIGASSDLRRRMMDDLDYVKRGADRSFWESLSLLGALWAATLSLYWPLSRMSRPWHTGERRPLFCCPRFGAWRQLLPRRQSGSRRPT